jgi:hypothetical protein
MHKALTKEKNNLVFIIHEKKILGVMLLNTTFDNSKSFEFYTHGLRRPNSISDFTTFSILELCPLDMLLFYGYILPFLFQNKEHGTKL